MKYYLLYLLMLFPFGIWAQQSPMLQTTRDQINREGMRIPQNNTVFGFKGEPGKLLGTNYLDTTWHAGTVKFYRPFNTLNVRPGTLPLDSLENVALRLDLLANEVEFLAGFKDVRSVKGDLVRRFTVSYPGGPSRQFANVQEYAGNNLPTRGFFETQVEGRLSLLVYHSVYIKKASYNPALNVGTKDDELINRVDWYAAKGRDIKKVSPGRKAILELMADKRPQIEMYMKTNNTDYRSLADMAKLISYYNSL